MRPNPGYLPDDTVRKRVNVVLRKGSRPAGSWAADGSNGCRWSLPGDARDFLEYEVAR